ncbi:MAG TPA: hypothetical protein VEK07_25140 [Polyangiaceae bacterium]|nr:hypothetical protein [Polyangiaceae bacterium]
MDAVVIRALDKNGGVLGIWQLPEYVDATATTTTKPPEEEHGTLRLCDVAQLLDRQGKWMAESFAAGKEAAAQSQGSMLEVLHAVTGLATSSLQSLFNVSAKVGELSAGDSGRSNNMQNILGLLLAGTLKGAAPGPTNGVAARNGSKEDE